LGNIDSICGILELRYGKFTILKFVYHTLQCNISNLL
jgi:hypothetical protein